MGHGSISLAVLGGGNGAFSMAADLAIKGFDVRLWSPYDQEMAPVRENGGIECEGLVQGHGPIRVATTDMAQAIDGAEFVMVVVPAFAHRAVARACAPHLKDGQTVVLHPGRTAGALEFRATLKAEGCTASVKVAEAVSLIYGCRKEGPAKAVIRRYKRHMPVAALPAADTPAVVAALRRIWGDIIAPAEDVLVSSMQNVGAVLHPSTLLFNVSRAEGPVPFLFYIEGITPFVADFLEKVDAERIAVANGLGLEGIMPVKEWLKAALDAQGETLMELKDVYGGSVGPRAMNHRYILEDIPCSVVPMCSLGDLVGVETPAMDAIVNLCCVAYGRDFWKEGRSLENLGLAGLSPAELRKAVYG